MSIPLSLPDSKVRSKGQAIIIPDGGKPLAVSIRDVSLTFVGLLASSEFQPGLRVQIDIHGHAAPGTVESCRPENDHFYVAVELDPAVA